MLDVVSFELMPRISARAGRCKQSFIGILSGHPGFVRAVKVAFGFAEMG